MEKKREKWTERSQLETRDETRKTCEEMNSIGKDKDKDKERPIPNESNGKVHEKL